jgi:phthalate 4,5-dioxygenase oxygenase subunit
MSSKGRPVRPVKLLGEDFVLFRDEQGRYGLLDRDCPHRGADLAFGRLEGGGVRCAFHGWLFDVEGKCLETPAEPKTSKLCSRHQAARLSRGREGRHRLRLSRRGRAAGIPRDRLLRRTRHSTPSPSRACSNATGCRRSKSASIPRTPRSCTASSRTPTPQGYGKQFRGASADSDMPITKVLREYDRPIISVEPTDYGLRLIALRELSKTSTHVRVTNVVFPQAFVIPMSAEMTISQWHVPVDDTHCYWYAIFTSFTGPVDKSRCATSASKLYELPDYTSRKNKRNNYGFSVDEQKPRPTPAWATTSTCTTSGRWSRRAPSRTARASTWAAPTRESSPTAACW